MQSTTGCDPRSTQLRKRVIELQCENARVVVAGDSPGERSLTPPRWRAISAPTT